MRCTKQVTRKPVLFQLQWMDLPALGNIEHRILNIEFRRGGLGEKLPSLTLLIGYSVRLSLRFSGAFQAKEALRRT